MEPIAVIGFAFKLPGGADDEDTLWRMVESGKNVSKDWPSSRINLNSFHDTNPQNHDCLRARGGHFLEDDPAAFDAPFFSITAKEAAGMDPQQRFMLETSYLALENAGIPVSQVSGSQTGLYEASMADDYSQLIYIDPDTAPRSAATGTARAMLANRVSWYFNLLGPSLHIDTACSGSMVALDLACSSLRNGDSSMALVAGSNLMLSPVCSMMLSRMNFLSPDSLCYSFDHRANGYARGEGVIVMVLKRLSDALDSGDTIRAVIRASGTNQDGRTPGLTQPSAAAQESLIRSVYAKANLDFALTRYVEAHGTGTPIGDPIEIQAIGRVFRNSRKKKEPLYVGSVKANIGHLEGGSGLAGVLKAIMMLERGVIPPNANFEKPNPDIDTDFYNVKIPTELIKWPTEGLRRISVNSFGFGGTNSHVAIDDAYHYLKLNNLTGITRTIVLPSSGASNVDEGYDTPSEDISTMADYRLLVLSAADEKSLDRTRENILQYYRQRVLGGSSSLDDLAYTLSTRRSNLLWRSYTVVDPAASNPEADVVVSKPQRSSPQKGIAFVFTGQGAEYSKMGLELMNFPVFKETMDKFDQILADLGCTWSLLDVLHGNENINQPHYSQPLCTALQIALVELLASLDIRPVAVVGHSSGEIAAAYCAGAFPIEAACRIAYYRGMLASKLRETITTGGAMMSVNLSASEVSAYIDRAFTDSTISPNLTVACMNSPKNVTISGDEAAIGVLKKTLDHDKVFAMKLSTGIAYHSPAMEAIAVEYADLIGVIESNCTPRQTVPMISSVQGGPVAAKSVRTASYWVQNLLSPVLFDSALRAVLDSNNKVQLGMPRRKPVYDLIEVGPHSALRRPCQDIMEAHPRKAEVRYTSVLSRNSSAVKGLLDLVGTLFATGYPVSITNANQPGRDPAEVSRCLVDLPGYPFDRSQPFWHESRISRDYRLRGEAPKSVLGARCADWTPLQPRWRKFINTREMPWVSDHVVSGNVIYPGAGMLIMALEASRQSAVGTNLIQGFVVKEALFSNPMVLRQDGDDERRVEAVCQLKPVRKLNDKDARWSEVTISTVHDDVWTECFRCTIQLQYDESQTEIDGGKEKALAGEIARKEYDQAFEKCATTLPSTSFYTYCTERGISYGPSFSILRNIRWNKDGTATGRVAVNQPLAEYEGIVHPAIVDAACQVCWLAPSKGLTEHMPTEVPHKLSDMYVAASGWKSADTSSVRICSTANFKEAGRGIEGRITVLADDGTLLCKVGRLELSPIADDALPNGRDRKLLHGIQKEPCLSLLSSAQVMKEITTEDTNTSIVPAKTEPQKFEDALQSVISVTLSELADLDTKTRPPHLQKYMAWLRDVHTKKLVWVADATPMATLSDLDRVHPEWGVHIAVACNLSQILRGEIDPLQVIFSTNLAERFYVDMFQRHCDTRFDRLLDLISFEKPGMKILEVGAGTGSMTSHVIAALRACEKQHGGVRFEKYTYTDISHAFFEEAKDRFKEHTGRMEFRVLDLEKDTVEQGYQEGAYDLVVAGAVLHTTESLQSTLQNVRKCLKPGGKLLFFENVLPDLALQFSFGTLSGWWRGKEDWRTGPRDQYTSEAQWHELLENCGFSGNDTVLNDQDSKTFSIIVSTAVTRREEPPNAQRVLMCLDKGSDEQCNLARGIEQTLAERGVYACESCDLEDMANMSIKPEDRVIVLYELGNNRLQSLREIEFRNVQSLMQKSKNILWLTETISDDEQSIFAGMSTGFLRTMRSEATNSRIVTLALERFNNDCLSSIDHVVAVFKRSFEESCSETEYSIENNRVVIGRLKEEILANAKMLDASYPSLSSGRWGDGPALKFDVGTRGTLDTLRFIEDPVYYEQLGPRDVEVDAKAWGLNFRDVFIALGRMDENEFGLDTAGYVTRVGSGCTEFKPGDRVVLACCGSFRMYPRADERQVTKIPDTMSFEDAASLPAPAVTAHYCLIDIAHLQKGEKVLIHSAAGSTGQLAVQIAKNVGAEVFATVSSDDKRNMLTTIYGIPDDHIFYSRNTTFAQGIMRMTEGQGVDVILNSLAGDALQASWECIAPFGRFVEIGKADIKAGSTLPMAYFEQNVSFSAVDLRQILAVRKDVIQKLIATMMENFESGNIACPHPRHLYPVSAMEDAFRFLQSGKNIGRIVINNTPDEVVPKFLAVRPHWSFDPCASYMIAGGLGGIGRAVCRYMARRGVKNLILPSRSGTKEKAAMDLVTELRTEGVNVVAPVCDVASLEAFSELLANCTETMPPIKGCINAAMVLQDAIFEHMTYDQWQIAVRAKVQTSWNLHKLLPSGMDFFVLLSSLAGVFGNVSQANYAAGNTFQDALADYRTAHGEQAISINLGWMRTIGIISEKEEYQSFRTKGADMAKIEEQELMSLLDIYCDPTYSHSHRSKSQVLIGTVTPADLLSNGLRVPDAMDRPLFSIFASCPESHVAADCGDNADAAVLFRQTDDVVQRGQIVADALAQKLARSLSMAHEDVDRDRPLFAYGVDSLVAVELRNWIGKEFSADVPVFDIMGGATITNIGALTVKNSTVGK
ncbi:hypothetical protein FB567DRAFT_598626 [Paraphoma chrysanthemicola]|uniref:Polyketide synthase n=1 Tax=Paraphoma chrysanthemicola TaxID=798071 RepID=A0A8K0QUW6_9PLEO|nr:hypothetical protein FB567DRAFT_598626 [Paraphoma chrysanthemicola]